MLELVRNPTNVLLDLLSRACLVAKSKYYIISYFTPYGYDGFFLSETFPVDEVSSEQLEALKSQLVEDIFLETSSGEWWDTNEYEILNSWFGTVLVEQYKNYLNGTLIYKLDTNEILEIENETSISC